MTAIAEAEDYSSNVLADLVRKLANAHNELGVCYMNKALHASTKMRAWERPSDEEQELWKKSYKCFDAGVKNFEEVKDVANSSLLLCNIGRLMRLCAQSYGRVGSSGRLGQFSSDERHYFNQALEYYQKALTRLGNRKKIPSCWDAVTWELCSTQFSLGCMLQDYAPLSFTSQELIEKEIQEFMNKALNLCERDDIPAVKLPLYQYRVAMIHHRIGSLHHNIYRNQSSQQKRKRTRTLAELHYNKAVKSYGALDRHIEVLRVQLEKLAIWEHQLDGQCGLNSRTKSLHGIFQLLTEARESLASFKEQDVESEKNYMIRLFSRNLVDDLDDPTEDGKVDWENRCEEKEKQIMHKSVGNENEEDSVVEYKGVNSGKALALIADVDEHRSDEAQASLDHAQVPALVMKAEDDMTQSDDVGYDGDKIVFHNKPLTSPPATKCGWPQSTNRLKVSNADNKLEKTGEKRSGRQHIGTSPAPQVSLDQMATSDGSTEGTMKVSGAGYASNEEELKALLQIFEMRLQSNLLKIIKLFHGNKKGDPLAMVQYKEVYALSLNAVLTKENKVRKVQTLMDCLDKLSNVLKLHPLM